MKNFIQEGRMLTMPAPYILASGDGALVGSIFGVAAYNAAQDDEVELATEGVFTLPKLTADDFALGAEVFWDDTEKKATVDHDEGANPKIGVAVQAAGDTATTLRVKLLPLSWVTIVPET